ncbi:hypothetical protein NL476_27015, partial [Klebsiella pneumoniae]|nr:hypothetical protein [Klebsiella pneumoniae]
SAAPSLDPRLDAEWEEWKREYEKTYSPEEEGHKRAVWESNRRMIQQHNKEYGQGKHSFTMKLNAFGDMTREEFRNKKGCLLPVLIKEERDQEGLLGNIPKSAD